ncbi:hypothetical protein J4423_04415 [Candidatus Pacearchaeota archaeon]|nr:hypothetical protein [Candidatus Pacearchaeota archaeon]
MSIKRTLVGLALGLAGCASQQKDTGNELNAPFGAPVKIFAYNGDEIAEQTVRVNGCLTEDYISKREGNLINIYQTVKKAMMPPRDESPIYAVEILEVDGDRYTLK